MTGTNPFDFRRFRNTAKNRTGGNSVTVTGENDLAETFVYAWIDSLTPATGTTPIEADVYLSGPTNLIPWTQAAKGQHLHYGEYDYETYPYRMKYETTLGTLTSTNLSYSRTFYVEADTQNLAYSGEISANVSVFNSYGYGMSKYDSVRYTSIAADIDVDSNNDGSINSTDDPIEMDGYGCLVLAGQSFSVEFSSIFTSQIDWDEYGLSFISSNTDVLDSFSIVDAAACFTNSGSVNFRNLTTKNASGETTLTFQIVDKSTSNVVASDSVVITVFTIGVDMAFNHNRLNNTGTDGINIRADGSDNKEIHAPELQMNPLRTGESWASPNGGIGSKKVLYLANSNVTVFTRFKTSLAIPSGMTLDLQAVAPNASIGGLGVETVTFDANGYSTGGSTIAGVTGFIEFTANESTDSAVSKEVSTFDWNVTKIKAKTNGTGKALTIEAVTFYTVLDDPMNSVGEINIDPYKIRISNVGGNVIMMGSATFIGGTTTSTITITDVVASEIVVVGSDETATTTITKTLPNGDELKLVVVGGTMTGTGTNRTITGAVSAEIQRTSGGTTATEASFDISLTSTTTTITITGINMSNSPWNTSDGAADDKTQPWVTALDFAIATAGASGEDTEALGTLTRFLHGQDDPTTTDVTEGHGLTYDTTNGANKYAGSYNGSSFNLSGYMTKSAGNVVNCYDQAAALTTLGQLLGIGVQYAFSGNFGYINTTTLVGDITTNNPFFGNSNNSSHHIVDITSPSSQPYRRIYDIDAAGVNHGDRSPFGNHAYVVYNGNVYDACGGPVTGETLSDYFEMIDFDANQQDNQFYRANPHLKSAYYAPFFEKKADCISDIAYFTIILLF